MPRHSDGARSGEACPRTFDPGVDAGSPTRTFAKHKIVAGTVLLASVLAGCSDLYFDRRETITFAAGEAVASAQAVQVINPWPSAAYNRSFASNGARVAGAVERYRTCQVVQPVGTITSSTAGYGAAAPTAQLGCAPSPATGPSNAATLTLKPQPY
jgi:hypothetical protein